MDINADGFMDIFSGCYSRQGGGSMAGIFQVFYGDKDGKFGEVTKLKGDDGKVLILPGDNDRGIIEKICTRPTAVDLNGDGHLDLVVGNFAGSFYFFKGLGKGAFSAKAEAMTLKDGSPLKVDHHSDPVLVDWDRDGDYDLVSGSNSGGAFLFRNEGTKKAWSFGKMEILVKGIPRPTANETMVFGEDHLTGPQSATRVWVEDLNGDGKVDLLIGDSVRIHQPGEGLSEAEALKKHAAFTKKRNKLMKGPDVDKVDWRKIYEEERKIIQTESTGFVWVLHQK